MDAGVAQTASITISLTKDQENLLGKLAGLQGTLSLSLLASEEDGIGEVIKPPTKASAKAQWSPPSTLAPRDRDQIKNGRKAGEITCPQ